MSVICVQRIGETCANVASSATDSSVFGAAVPIRFGAIINAIEKIFAIARSLTWKLGVSSVTIRFTKMKFYHERQMALCESSINLTSVRLAEPGSQ